MIFTNLISEDILQVNDKARFSMEKSFTTPDEGNILEIEISFDGANYIDVYKAEYPRKWFTDYAYDTAGEKDIKVKITTDIGFTEDIYKINIISAIDDALFSKDSQLFNHESELINLMPKGKNSYKNKHRSAQEKVMRYLDGEGVRFLDGEPFGKLDLVDNIYISEWSTYLTLSLIFQDLVVKPDDINKKKVNHYNKMLTNAIKNAFIRMDFNKDGEIKPSEGKNVTTKFIGR